MTLLESELASIYKTFDVSQKIMKDFELAKKQEAFQGYIVAGGMLNTMEDFRLLRRLAKKSINEHLRF